jgi:hypothetical protein
MSLFRLRQILPVKNSWLQSIDNQRIVIEKKSAVGAKAEYNSAIFWVPPTANFQISFLIWLQFIENQDIAPSRNLPKAI